MQDRADVAAAGKDGSKGRVAHDDIHPRPEGCGITNGGRGGAIGRANVSAIASPMSGEGTPRRRMSSFFSSSSRVLLSYLYEGPHTSACTSSLSGIVTPSAPSSHFFMLSHISARLLAGPPKGRPLSSSGAGSIGEL